MTLIARSFTWTRNGVYLNVARDPQVSMRWRSGTLEIFFWGRPDDYEGVYQCTATNEFGSALSSYINLRVSSKPIHSMQLLIHSNRFWKVFFFNVSLLWSEARTWLKEYLEPVSVVVGLPLILPCNPPVGPPKPDTYWLNSSKSPTQMFLIWKIKWSKVALSQCYVVLGCTLPLKSLGSIVFLKKLKLFYKRFLSHTNAVLFNCLFIKELYKN